MRLRSEHRIACLALAGAAWLASQRVSAAPVQEPYVSASATIYSSQSALYAGFGAGIGYRLQLGTYFGVYAEAHFADYIGFHGTADLGVFADVRGANPNAWHPMFGLQAGAFFGDDLVESSVNGTVATGSIVPVVQLRIAPLHFVNANWVVTVLSLDLGIGLTDFGVAAGIDFMQVGYRF